MSALECTQVASSVLCLLMVFLLGRARRKFLREANAHRLSKVRFDLFVHTSRERAKLLADAMKLQNEAYAHMRDGNALAAADAWDRGQAAVRASVARYEHDEAKYADMDVAVEKALKEMGA